MFMLKKLFWVQVSQTGLVSGGFLIYHCCYKKWTLHLLQMSIIRSILFTVCWLDNRTYWIITYHDINNEVDRTEQAQFPLEIDVVCCRRWRFLRLDNLNVSLRWHSLVILRPEDIFTHTLWEFHPIYQITKIVPTDW